MPKSPRITGTFRITHMEQWDQDYVDAEGPGFFRFDSDCTGAFRFGHVHGQMSCEFTERDVQPAVEWSWDGHDEMDPATGRGWAVLGDNGSLRGKLFFHEGDSSGFTAAPQGKRRDSKCRKAQPLHAQTDKVVEVAIDKIRPGRVRHPSLPDKLLRRIQKVHEAVKDVYGLNLEQLELSFMRDAAPEREIALWERIVAAMEKVGQALPQVERKVLLRTLLSYSMGALTPVEKASPVVRKIIRIAEGK
jgi:hypothetical protein